MTVVEFLNPLGWVREPVAAGDGEGREATVLNIPIWRLGEGFDIPDKMGLHKLDGFVMVIQLLLVVRFLGSKVLGEAMALHLQSDNQSVDDGLVGVGWEVMA